ncbi:MAG: DUF1707 domain-containing protein [Nakamurella sp.]
MTAPQMRAGTADRQRAVDRLTQHFADGRLDAGEFDERVGKAYAAVHLDELPALFADLPEDEQRRGPRRDTSWENTSGRSGAPGRPGQWSGPARSPMTGTPFRRPPFRRPPPVFLILLVVLALMFAFGAISHGFFPFPLIWIALGVFLFSRGHRRRRWAEENYHRGHR